MKKEKEKERTKEKKEKKEKRRKERKKEKYALTPMHEIHTLDWYSMALKGWFNAKSNPPSFLPCKYIY